MFSSSSVLSSSVLIFSILTFFVCRFLDFAVGIGVWYEVPGLTSLAKADEVALTSSINAKRCIWNPVPPEVVVRWSSISIFDNWSKFTTLPGKNPSSCDIIISRSLFLMTGPVRNSSCSGCWTRLVWCLGIKGMSVFRMNSSIVEKVTEGIWTRKPSPSIKN